jgi:hypothetical protein
MADKEISALPTSLDLFPTDWFHVKQGVTDVKMSINTILDGHINSANPHGVTKSQVGLANVLDVEQLEKAQNLADIPSTSSARTNLGVDSSATVTAKVNAHANLVNNPHGVTKAQVGLSNVPNYSITTSERDASDTKFASASAVNTVSTRIDNLTAPIPIGAIVMWSSFAGVIPAGYALCNGQTVGGIRTPDLVGRFIKGSTLEGTDDDGGSNTTTHTHSGTIGLTSLEIRHIPAHQHATGWGQKEDTYRVPPYGKTGNKIRGASGDDTQNDEYLTSVVGANASPTDTEIIDTPAGYGVGHDHTLAADSTTLDNQPEFYTLAFIMRYE